MVRDSPGGTGRPAGGRTPPSSLPTWGSRRLQQSTHRHQGSNPPSLGGFLGPFFGACVTMWCFFSNMTNTSSLSQTSFFSPIIRAATRHRNQIFLNSVTPQKVVFGYCEGILTPGRDLLTSQNQLNPLLPPTASTYVYLGEMEANAAESNWEHDFWLKPWTKWAHSRPLSH